MSNSNHTHIAIVADRSGSMSTIARDMNGGLETFLKEQNALEGKLTIDITTFDGAVEAVATDAQFSDIKFPVIVPRGSTALNDGIGIAVNSLNERIKALPSDERPGKKIVLIITDGGENASSEYTSDQVKKLVTSLEKKKSWEFIFLGANIDSFAVGGGYGFSKGSTMNYVASAQGVNSILRGATAYVTSVRLGEDTSLSETVANLNKN